MNKTNSGQMLVEALISLSVVVLVLVALVAGAVIATRNARHSKNMVLANHYAQEALEFFKKEKESRGWSDFKNNFPPGAVQTLDKNKNYQTVAVCPQTANIDNIFRRCVAFGSEVDSSIQITATVSWNDSGCSEATFCHQAEMVTVLSKWSK